MIHVLRYHTAQHISVLAPFVGQSEMIVMFNKLSPWPYFELIDVHPARFAHTPDVNLV